MLPWAAHRLGSLMIVACAAALAITAVVSAGGVVAQPQPGPGAPVNDSCREVTVSPPTTVLSAQRRRQLGLTHWPDTQPGVLRLADGSYRFLASQGQGEGRNVQQQVITLGSLDATAHRASTSTVAGVPTGHYQYVGVGQVYRDPATGEVLQTIHLERLLPGHRAHPYYTEIGLGRVDPTTYRTTFLGVVVQSALSDTGATRAGFTVDLGTPSLVAPGDGYLYMYFGDFSADGAGRPRATSLAAARTPVTDAITAAQAGTVTPWQKYVDGSWSSPGNGGAATDLQPGQRANWEPSAAYSPSGRTTLLVAPVSREEIRLSHTTSSGWSRQVTLWSDRGKFDAYPVIVGDGLDPAQPGRTFYVYYLQWQDSRTRDWTTAVQLRRTVTCHST
ncbi:MAG: hypothetical protein DLM57_12960 [Pseudonocardiales bacterium]|nr:MAG: hypothetical protein DLM57_12960 [Pseudonocardiales bacterium]